MIFSNIVKTQRYTVMRLLCISSQIVVRYLDHTHQRARFCARITLTRHPHHTQWTILRSRRCALENCYQTTPHRSGSHCIIFRFKNHATIMVRTSGTEPKIKYYAEMRGESKGSAQKELDSMIADVIEHWYQPEKNGFQSAAS